MKKKDKFRWMEGRSATANAAAKLPALAHAYFRAGRTVAASANDPAALHGFRVQTKRFRYTLELFHPCYGPALDSRLEALRQIQQCLGEMSDYATVRKLMTSARLKADLARRVEAKIAEFRDLWQNRFDRYGEESRWTRHLARSSSARR